MTASASEANPFPARPDPSAFTIMPRRHYGRWLATALILLAIGGIVRAFALGQIEWAVVAQFLTAPAILFGLVNTIIMAIAAMGLGITLGVLFAVMVMSPNPVLHYSAKGYIWFFRGTPLILQLLLWFNLALVFRRWASPGSSNSAPST